jgi:peptidoglycan/xylan/chitin deacetylase (PgdA/CDA1 family)
MMLNGIPVLNYHGLSSEYTPGISRRERKYWMAPARFREQLAVLCQEGYECTTVPSFWTATDSAESQKSVVLTFDDGRVSDYEFAFPALVQAGLPATFFVNTANVGSSGYLTWLQIREMVQAGMSFQSHSHDHLYLTALGRNELRRQLEFSKRMLEDQIGSAVKFLAAPYGDLSPPVLMVAEEIGYSAVCSSRSWPARSGSALINRAVIYGTTTLSEFRRLASRNAFSYCVRIVRSALLYVPKECVLKARRSRSKEIQAVTV